MEENNFKIYPRAQITSLIGDKFEFCGCGPLKLWLIFGVHVKVKILYALTKVS